MRIRFAHSSQRAAGLGDSLGLGPGTRTCCQSATASSPLRSATRWPLGWKPILTVGSAAQADADPSKSAKTAFRLRTGGRTPEDRRTAKRASACSFHHALVPIEQNLLAFELRCTLPASSERAIHDRI